MTQVFNDKCPTSSFSKTLRMVSLMSLIKDDPRACCDVYETDP